MNQEPEDGRIIYTTGANCDGVPLIGGVWTLWEQEGFPLEMSYLICRDKGWAVDWLEAMADASVNNNCPALMKHVSGFLPDEAILAMKLGFMRVVKTGKTWEQVVAEKRKNGRNFCAFIEEEISKLEKST